MARIIAGTLTDEFATPFRVKPYAAFALGDDLMEEAKTGLAVGADLCGGSSLIKAGAPVDHGWYAGVSDGNNWKTAFTATQLLAAESLSACTLIAFAKVPAGSFCNVVNSYNAGSTNPAITLELGTANLCRVIVQPNGRIASLANDAARGNRWAMYAAVVTATSAAVFERHKDAAMATASVTFASQTNGGGVFNIGERDDQAGDTGSIALTLLFGHALDAEALEARYQEARRWLNPQGADL